MTVKPFHDVSLDQLTRWAKQIKIFRLVASKGYNKESCDTLLVRLRYDSPADFLSLLATLGVPANKLTPGSIQPRVGGTYTAKQAQQFEYPIDDVPGYRQPGICQLGQHYLLIWADRGVVKITYSHERGPSDYVGDLDVANAASLEQFLLPLADKLIDPPVDSEHCFCPKYYPYAFKS